MSRISFDDIQVGDEIISARITVTESHIVGFAGITGDFNPLHMDDEFARENGFGCRIAHGMLGHSLSTGLRSKIDDWAILAFLETRRRFVGPILMGDTIHYRATVLETRPSQSKPDRGVVRVSMELVKQTGEVVQSGEDSFLVERLNEKG
ncbi:MaoC/PaaZ C-terminal domain-containing protein [Daeguia caeni]|uniref:MaoC/PaaZ C-terminal domain-containing protein n=1 Tax=Daeguia caeni TaxID=439612 RepID=A0ABV9H2J4_9HYPH